MLLSPRVRQRDLAALCQRLATALASGVEVRRVFSREAGGRSATSLRQQLDKVSAAIAGGASLHDAIAETGKFFPIFFREMVLVGEQTGHSAEVFRQLAQHYDHQVRLRRMFLQSITWPLVQLASAIAIVGLVIFLMGFISGKDLRGQPIDILGFGLIGTPGLIKYFTGVGLVLVAFVLLYHATRRGVFWTRPIERLVLKIPVLGRALEVLALARLAWSLNLTCGVGMDLLRALPLSIRSMQSAYYADQCESVLRSLRKGEEISEALATTGVFPADFLDALEVGERSGRLPETMATLSEQYQDQAQRALATVTVVAGFAVWAMVAGLIVFLIFRIFSFYIAQINAAMK